MLVDTKYLGKQEIEETMVIHFESGIPGFHEEKEFVVLDIPENDMLQIMQSINNSNLAFFITNPHYFYRDYSFELEESVREAINVERQEDIVILVIMTVQDPFEKSTLNLRAPIIINSANKLGKQYILNDDSHSLKAGIQLPTKESRE